MGSTGRILGTLGVRNPLPVHINIVSKYAYFFKIYDMSSFDHIIAHFMQNLLYFEPIFDLVLSKASIIASNIVSGSCFVKKVKTLLECSHIHPLL